MLINTYNIRKDVISTKELKEAADFYINLLLKPRQHKNVKLKIVMESIPYKAYIEWTDKPVKPKQFKIALSNKYKRKETLIALAHELVHLKQYVIGDLTDETIRSKPKWRKQEIDEEKIHYYDLPYEIEAYGREWGLYSRYQEHLAELRGAENKAKREYLP